MDGLRAYTSTGSALEALLPPSPLAPEMHAQSSMLITRIVGGAALQPGKGASRARTSRRAVRAHHANPNFGQVDVRQPSRRRGLRARHILQNSLPTPCDRPSTSTRRPPVASAPREWRLVARQVRKLSMAQVLVIKVLLEPGATDHGRARRVVLIHHIGRSRALGALSARILKENPPHTRDNLSQWRRRRCRC